MSSKTARTLEGGVEDSCCCAWDGVLLRDGWVDLKYVGQNRTQVEAAVSDGSIAAGVVRFCRVKMTAAHAHLRARDDESNTVKYGPF